MKHTHLTLAICMVVSSVLLTGCDKSPDETPKQGTQQQALPIVNVFSVTLQPIPLEQEFSGRTVAYQKSDVRPQTTGIIEEILFNEGSMVKKDQPLYRINYDTYRSAVIGSEAAVNQAIANVNTAKAGFNNAIANQAAQQALLEEAKKDLERLGSLVDIDAISRQQYDRAVTKYKTAQAAVASAKAAAAQSKANIDSADAMVKTAQSKFDTSKIDLNRTIVRAPIAGKTSRSTVTAGALVGANQATPLVTVSKLNPIYVDISQSSADLLKLKRQAANGDLTAGSNAVELVLEDGSRYSTRGKLLLEDAQVDEASGSITLRAVFKNDNLLLMPGMYVTAKLTQAIIPNAALVPQSAIMRNAKGETHVYIVDADNKIKMQSVQTSGTYAGNWIVTDGLNVGDKVVALGGSKVKPDQQVEVQPMPAPSQSATSNGNTSKLPNNAGAQTPIAQLQPISDASQATPVQPKPIQDTVSAASESEQ